MKIKTADLIGLALDWAVAQCEMMREDYRDRGLLVHRIGYGQPMPPYSTDWSRGGPIIERWELGLKRNAPCSQGREWEASPSITAKGAGGKWGYGPTPLIAAMRCYVASHLGDEVDAPDELV